VRRFAPWLALALAGCPAADNPNPCPNGICTGAVDGGTGAPPDLAGAPCVESWLCDSWQPAGNNLYSRNCTDNNRCGTTVHKPPVGPIPLPALDLDYFKCKVEPILDRGCAMMDCHGTKASDSSRLFRVFARGRRRNSEMVPPLASCAETTPQNLEQVGSGTIQCHGASAHTATEWQMNFDSARAQMLGFTNPDQSDLLLEPVNGGKSHNGVHLFADKNDPDYVTIKNWLSGAALGAVCDPLN